MTFAERTERNARVVELAKRARRLRADERENYEYNSLLQLRSQHPADPLPGDRVGTLDVELPTSYREHLIHVADGGYGPGFGMLRYTEASDMADLTKPFSFQWPHSRLPAGSLRLARYPGQIALLIVTVVAASGNNVHDSSTYRPGDVAIMWHDRGTLELFDLTDGEDVHGTGGGGLFGPLSFDRWYDNWIEGLDAKIDRAERRQGT